MSTTEDQEKLNKINERMMQLTDYLFDKGFEVNKPLMWAIAEWFIEIEEAVYLQGKQAGEQS